MIDIDIEVYSDADLPTVGSVAYAKHYSTEILCMAYKIDNKEIKITKNIADMHFLLSKQDTIYAYNASFECIVLNEAFIKRGLTPINIDKYVCTFASASYLGLSVGLDELCRAFGMEGKSKEYKKLISLCCTPKGMPTYDDYNRLYEYCKRDVELEYKIRKRVLKLPERERKIYELDHKINTTGFKFDLDLVDKLYSTATNFVDKYSDISDLTNGAVDKTSKKDAIKRYLINHGIPALDVSRESLNELKGKCGSLNSLIDRMILTSESSYTKLLSLKKSFQCTKTARCYNTAMYYGAHTGRWTGKTFQHQNLPRPVVDPDFDGILAGKDFGEDTLKMVTSCIRGCIIPEDGNKLVVADFNAIEPRVLRALSNDPVLVDVFDNDLDLYKYVYSKMFNVAYDEVTKDQRSLAKIYTLALTYGGSHKSLIRTASNAGITISNHEAVDVVDRWRRAHSGVVRLWHSLLEKYHNSALKAIREGDDFASIKLPSGRSLFLFKPFFIEGELRCYGVSRTRMVENRLTTNIREKKIWHGTSTENVVQAIARDVLADAMLNLDDAGYKIILHVHDEIVLEVPKDTDINDIIKIMELKPTWSKSIKLKVDAFECERYRK